MYDRPKKRKKKKKYSENKEKKNRINWTLFFSKILCTIILTLSALILLKQDTKLKEVFYKNVFEKNFSFAKINELYQKTFGSVLPFKENILKDIEPVFNEKLSYKEVSKYLDGAKLTVQSNYLVPAYETGMVVFVGEKEGYGKTIIIEGTDGVEIWYGNLEKTDVKVYDYIEKGSYLGEVKEKELYLVFKKDGNPLDYAKYIS